MNEKQTYLWLAEEFAEGRIRGPESGSLGLCHALDYLYFECRTSLGVRIAIKNAIQQLPNRTNDGYRWYHGSPARAQWCLDQAEKCS